MPTKPTKKDRRDASKQARLEAELRAKKQRRMRFLYVGIGAAAFIALIFAIPRPIARRAVQHGNR